MTRKNCYNDFCYDNKTSKVTCYDDFCFEEDGDEEERAKNDFRNTLWIGLAALALLIGVGIFA